MLTHAELKQVQKNLAAAYEKLRMGVPLDHPLQCTAEHILFCLEDVNTEADLEKMGDYFRGGGAAILRPLSPQELRQLQGLDDGQAQCTKRPFTGPFKG